MKTTKTLERDISILALLNKASELITLNMNESRDSKYNDVGTMIFNIRRTIEDGIREDYVDIPLQEVDSTKYTNVKVNNNNSDDNDNDNDNDDDTSLV